MRLDIVNLSELTLTKDKKNAKTAKIGKIGKKKLRDVEFLEVYHILGRNED